MPFISFNYKHKIAVTNNWTGSRKLKTWDSKTYEHHSEDFVRYGVPSLPSRFSCSYSYSLAKPSGTSLKTQSASTVIAAIVT